MENQRSYSGEQLQKNTECQNTISTTKANWLDGMIDEDAIRSSVDVEESTGAVTETPDISQFPDWFEEFNRKEIPFNSSVVQKINIIDSPKQIQLHSISIAQPSVNAYLQPPIISLVKLPVFSNQHKPLTSIFTDNSVSRPMNMILTTNPHCYLNQSSTELLNSNTAATSSPWQCDTVAEATSSSWHQNSRTMATPKLSHQSSVKRMKRRIDGSKEIIEDSDSDDFDDYDSSDDQSQSDDDNDGDNKELNRNCHRFAEEFLDMEQKKRNFWFYNSQSRGPKGKRLYEPITLKDVHVLDEFTDPLIAGASKHSNVKLRHGDGNDPRPDTHKLLDIGAKIKKLEDKFRSISATGVKKEAANKEKNKLASRICRLKKKAQHEANKLKLEGLREEHKQLINVIGTLVTSMNSHIISTAENTNTNRNLNSTSNQLQQPGSSSTGLSSQLQMLIQQNLKYMIAGHTTNYVNSQIENVARKITNRKLT